MNMNFCYECGRQDINTIHTSLHAFCPRCYAGHASSETLKLLAPVTLFDNLQFA